MSYPVRCSCKKVVENKFTKFFERVNIYEDELLMKRMEEKKLLLEKQKNGKEELEIININDTENSKEENSKEEKKTEKEELEPKPKSLYEKKRKNNNNNGDEEEKKDKQDKPSDILSLAKKNQDKDYLFLNGEMRICKKKALDDLGIMKPCCRTLFLDQPDLNHQIEAFNIINEENRPPFESVSQYVTTYTQSSHPKRDDPKVSMFYSPKKSKKEPVRCI